VNRLEIKKKAGPASTEQEPDLVISDINKYSRSHVPAWEREYRLKTYRYSVLQSSMPVDVFHLFSRSESNPSPYRQSDGFRLEGTPEGSARLFLKYNCRLVSL